MSDIFSKKKRSEVMAAVRSRRNKSTELALASALRKARIKGWRRHLPVLGRPDFAFPKLRVAVFVDGCFWHGCPRCSSIPASNRAYWIQKIARNRKRDTLVSKTLKRDGVKVLRIWEHSLRTPSGLQNAVFRIRSSIKRTR